MIRGRKRNPKLTERQERELMKRAGLDLDAIEEGRRREKEQQLYARGRGLKPARNPEAQASTLSEAFHGRPAQTVTDVEEELHQHAVLTDLGQLRELQVLLSDTRLAVISFTPAQNVRLAASEDGTSLYFVGGRQALRLEKFGLAAEVARRDHVAIGRLWKITYYTSKAFHNFSPHEYEHEFAEDGGELPILAYDRKSQKPYLVGGSYTVKAEGIVN